MGKRSNDRKQKKNEQSRRFRERFEDETAGPIKGCAGVRGEPTVGIDHDHRLRSCYRQCSKKKKRERDSCDKARNRSWWGLSWDRHRLNRSTRYAEACRNPSGDALC